MVAIQYK